MPDKSRAKKEVSFSHDHKSTGATTTTSTTAAAAAAAGPLKNDTFSAKQKRASRLLNCTDYKYMLFLLAATLVIRLYRIDLPSSVVFDEVHFGGFARKYIIGRFFMDVHPPLAKMLYAVVGWLAGYDGEFEFQTIGLDYLDANVPYVIMRAFPALCGIGTVLLAYPTLRFSGCRSQVALFGAGLISIDNALITQSRYILLDSPLLLFMAITAYAFKRSEIEIPFSKGWMRYLFLSGLALGATLSSKWVGLFTTGWLGTMTVYQLWWLLGDLNVTMLQYMVHFLYRAFALIVVPVAFYLGMFLLHFSCVVNDGDGASFMSSEFRSTLQHSNVNVYQPADVAYGSQLVIRHYNTNGGYLHSHEHMYETGSQQQQITLYPHKDDNNLWQVENFTAPAQDDLINTSEGPVWLEDGAIIKLKHVMTGKRLHSHDHRPPVSEKEYQNEVSAYGYEGFEGDANDNFRVEIVRSYSEKGDAQSRVRTIQTKFKLVHTMTGCVLFSHNVKLPKWGFEQQEVTCVRGGTLPNSIWYVEENSHPKLDSNVEHVQYKKIGFLRKFIELNKVMWNVNAGLTDTHNWESRPESWPLLKRGINYWVKDNRQVYLLGNGVIWWSVTANIVIYVLGKIIWVLRWQRGVIHQPSANYSTYDSGVGSYLLAWAMHFFPSFLMMRQLFLHHYLGALYFGILALAQTFEFVLAKFVPNKIRGTFVLAVFFAASSLWTYWYAPLIYGGPWTRSLCEKSKFLDMDFDCNAFLSTLDEYSHSQVTNDTQPTTHTLDSDLPTEHEPQGDTRTVLTEYEDNDFHLDVEESVHAEPVRSVEDGTLYEGHQDVPDEDARRIQYGISDAPTRASAVVVDGETMELQLQEHSKKVEYRDAEGNPLDPEEVNRLLAAGEIQVETRQEIKEQFYDPQGNLVDSDRISYI